MPISHPTSPSEVDLGRGTSNGDSAHDNRNELLASGPDTDSNGIPDASTADTYTYYDDGGQWTVYHASTSTTDTFTYDVRGRLSSTTIGGVSTTYAYDTEGNRVAETTGGDETTFLVDSNNPTGYAQVLEQQGDTNLTYILGASVLGQIDSAGHAETLVTDGQGSTRMVLDDAGNIVTRFDYDAFGNIINPDASQDVTLIRYTNEMWDPATSEYDLRAREYQPMLGRFTSQDSMFFGPGDLGNANLYLYVNGNPINAIDPSGHDGLAGLLVAMGIEESLASTISVVTTTVATRAIAGAFIGGLFGAIDAYVGGGDANAIIQEAEQGAESGAAVGVVFPSLPGALRLAAIVYSTWNGVSDSLSHDLPDQALFRFGAGMIAVGASVPNAPAENMIAALTRLAGEAEDNAGSGQGSRIHSQFASLIKQEGLPDLSTEVSYLNGVRVDYGTSGSIRADVVQGNIDAPEVIYDLKTGGAELTPARIAEIRANLPAQSKNIPIIEIRKP